MSRLARLLASAALAAAALGAAPAALAQAAPATREAPPYFYLRVADQNVTIRVLRPVVEPKTPVFSGSLTGSRDVGADGIATIRVRGTGRVGIGLNVIEIGEQGVSVNGAPLLDSSVTLNLDGSVAPGAGASTAR